MSTIRPAGITADRQSRQFTINWSDGHTSVYPFALLRYACPCASCRGGHEKMTTDPDPQVFLRPVEDTVETRIQNVEPVGSYALVITWEDGHQYGIYNWRYLRALCPCPQCRSG